MSASILLSLPPHHGCVFVATPPKADAAITGTLTPVIFHYPHQEGTGKTVFTAGVVKDHMQAIELVPIATTITEDMVRVLGWRWMHFVSSLMERNLPLSPEIAREAWVAANRQPEDVNRYTTERGVSVMYAHIGKARTDEIRQMQAA